MTSMPSISHPLFLSSGSYVFAFWGSVSTEAEEVTVGMFSCMATLFKAGISSWWGCPVHCQIFISSPGLLSLHANNYLSLSLDNHDYIQKLTNAPWWTKSWLSVCNFIKCIFWYFWLLKCSEKVKVFTWRIAAVIFDTQLHSQLEDLRNIPVKKISVWLWGTPNCAILFYRNIYYCASLFTMLFGKEHLQNFAFHSWLWFPVGLKW